MRDETSRRFVLSRNEWMMEMSFSTHPFQNAKTINYYLVQLIFLYKYFNSYLVFIFSFAEKQILLIESIK